ncbi:hypothetical protein Tco_1184565 [Tanacetum coccineum]
MTMAPNTQPPYQTTASAGGKLLKAPLQRRNIPYAPEIRKKNPNLLTIIVDRASKLFCVSFGKRNPPVTGKLLWARFAVWNTTREEGQCGNCASISAATVISDLEQVLQQKTFTRSEIEWLKTLLHSRSNESSSRANLYSSPSSKDLEEEIASPVELAKAYMGSRPSKALRQDLEQDHSILFGLLGSRQQKFLVLRFFDVKEQQGIDRLNIKKLNGNIVQKHGGLKEVGFKQLGPGVETGVPGVSNDDTVVAQRRLEDKQPKEKTNTDYLVKEQKKEYQTRWKIKTGLQQQNGLVKETNVTLLAKEYGVFMKGEYKKTFIGFDVGTVQKAGASRNETLREDSNEATFAVAAVKKIYAHESLTFNDTVACEKCSNDSNGYYWESTPDFGLKGHSIQSLKGSSIWDYYWKEWIKFHRRLQIEVQVFFMDFDLRPMVGSTHKNGFYDTKDVWKLRSYNFVHDGFCETTECVYDTTEAA